MLANLLAWSLQVAVVIAAVATTLRLLGPLDPRVRLHAWHLTLLVALALPLVQPWQIALAVAGGPGNSLALPETALDWRTIAAVVLIGGTALRVTWLVFGILRLRRLRRTARPWTPRPHWLTRAEAAAGASAVVDLSDEVTSPVTFGGRHPLILVPTALASVPAAQQFAMVTHELHHVARRDWLAVITEECVRAAIKWTGEPKHDKTAPHPIVKDKETDATHDKVERKEKDLPKARTVTPDKPVKHQEATHYYKVELKDEAAPKARTASPEKPVKKGGGATD